MKEPSMEVRRPWERDYEERIKDIIIYTYYENCPREDYYDEEDDDPNGYKERFYNDKSWDKDQPKFLLKSLKDIDLQYIIDKIPLGVSAKDIKMSINIDTSDMAVEGASITFSYKKKFPANPEGYKLEKEKYDEAWAEYLDKKSKYDAWKKEQEIKDLEKKLNKLKSK